MNESNTCFLKSYASPVIILQFGSYLLLSHLCTTTLSLQIDVNNTTLGDVVTRVLKAKLGFNEPSIMMGSCFLYEEGRIFVLNICTLFPFV